MIYLRVTGWPCEVVGFGDAQTGLCTMRLVGGPDHGKEFAEVHYSDLIGDTGGQVAFAFYGKHMGGRTEAKQRYRAKKRQQKVGRDRSRDRRVA